MRIFLTGAAGLIGGEVARRLVARGHLVTAGVHANPVVRGNDAAPVAVADTVRIELGAPGLGLTEAQAEAVAGRHDLILHCAATTRFDLDASVYDAVNVRGTADLLALAGRRDVPMLYIGTAYVCGARDGPIYEDDPLPRDGFANRYEASKAAAEALVSAASPRHAIARPSIVLGEHARGTIRGFDALYGAFKLFAEGRLQAVPTRAGATLDFVPIDHVAGGLVAIAEDMAAAAGGRFHLVSAEPIPVADWVAAIAAYPQFHAPALVSPERFDPAALPATQRRLFARVAAPYASYFQRDPRFDDRRFAALTGIAAPVTGKAYVRRLIDHAIEAGFLRAAT